MTAYIRRSNPAKRLAILKEREARLKRTLLPADAEKVKAARLLVLKGQRYYALETGTVEKTDFERIARIDAEMGEWESKTPEAIIAFYQAEWQKMRAA